MPKLNSQQVLIPKKVYIGDKAEIRCTFNSNSKLLQAITKNGAVNLSTEHFNLSENNDYDIKSISLSTTGVDYYQMSILFVPWKTGTLEIPDIQLEDIILEIDPVSIVSLTEQGSTSTLKDSAGPLLLPGTTYKLYGLLIFFIVLILAVIELFVKRKKLAFFLKNKRLLHRYKKNKRKTIKALKTLLLSQLTDSAFAGGVQSLLRNYLEVRLDYPFTKAATSELMNCFYAATSHLLSEKKEEAFGQITAAFIRTDYIRYSAKATFKQNERTELTENLIQNINIMEETYNA